MADQPGMTAEQIAIRDLLARINNAWINQQGEAMIATLKDCFAEDVVMRGPGFASGIVMNYVIAWNRKP